MKTENPENDDILPSTNPVKQVIVVRKDLNMRKGKLAAQVAHAAMAFLLAHDVSVVPEELKVKLLPHEDSWLKELHTKIVVSVGSEQELLDLMEQARLDNIECHSIVDAGLTEFHGVSTLTCAAFGPDKSEFLDRITGHLKLM